MWQRKNEGLFFHGEKADATTWRLVDFDTGAVVGEAAQSDLKQIKPNSSIRALIGSALFTFQLNDSDRAKRADALLSLESDANADLLAPPGASIEPEIGPELKMRKQGLERLLTMSNDPDPGARIAAIDEMSGDLGLDVRGDPVPQDGVGDVGNPERVDMLTFGLGSGIAGVAIGPYAKVTSELGAGDIVPSLMAVMVGGVGKIWGPMAGAGRIGFKQKSIEWVYPSNTLSALTHMIVFLIVFIRFRPRASSRLWAGPRGTDHDRLFDPFRVSSPAKTGRGPG